jgi:hypothetical protein
MLTAFLALVSSSVSLEFYSFIDSHICDCFSFCSMFIIPLGILCNADLVDMNAFAFNLFLSWMIFIFPLRFKESFAG